MFVANSATVNDRTGSPSDSFYRRLYVSMPGWPSTTHKCFIWLLVSCVVWLPAFCTSQHCPKSFNMVLLTSMVQPILLHHVVKRFLRGMLPRHHLLSFAIDVLQVVVSKFAIVNDRAGSPSEGC